MTTIKERLTQFIKQYYLNKILRGSLFLGISFIVLLLVFSTIEFFGWFNSGTRAFLFYFYLGFNALVLWFYLLVPFSRLLGIAKGIGIKMAAKIIGQHFPQIEDKLLNLLQLQEQDNTSTNESFVSKELIEEAIRQKELMLRPFPFVKAIEFRSSLRYARYLVPALLVFIALLGFKPELIKDPVRRIRNYHVHYEKPAPFSFVVLNEDLTGVAKSNYTLRFTTKGQEMPSEAYIEVNGINYKAQKKSRNIFEYEFRNIQGNVDFRMNSVNIWSAHHRLNVIPRPSVKSFTVYVEYPSYTNKTNEEIDNVGDLVVPRGTMLTWRFNTHHTDGLKVFFDEIPVTLKKESQLRYSFAQRIMKNVNYSVTPVNEFIDTLSPVGYTLEVIPDENPAIQVSELFDSLNQFFVFFTGEIADDYGFTGLKYHAAHVRNQDTLSKKITPLPYAPSELKQQFMHFADLRNLGFIPGDELIWFFEVWDNDQIMGPKSVRTYTGTYQLPGLNELNEIQDQLEEEIKDEMDKAIRTAQAIRQEAREMQNELRFKEQLNWQDRDKISQLLQRQDQLKNQMEYLKKKVDHKYQKENQFKEIDRDILEKQKQLQDLMDKLLDEDTRKLMEEIQKLMDELNKDKIGEMLEKIQMNNEELNLELERNLELFKQLELEKELHDNIQALEKLAEEQKKLAEESLQKNADVEKIKKEQNQLNQEFDQISDELKKIEEKNQSLEFPNQLQNTDQEQQDIKKEMKQSMQNLQQGKPQKAGQNQQNSSDKLKELSDKLNDMLDDMLAEQLAEDIMTLRLILNNLIHLSLEQEKLMEVAKKTSRVNPKYPEIINQQNKLRRDFQIVEDSLVALGKRQMAVKSIVSKEISNIKESMEQSVNRFLDVHTVGIRNAAGREQGIERQQYAMTSMNNLALLLAESLDSMRDQQNQQSGEGKQCDKPKPGSGKPSLKQMRQNQQSLNQQLQQMKQHMEQQGQQPNGKRNSMSEQFARMAAEQEALRRALNDYMQELQGQGIKDLGEFSELMEEMEKTEEELVNKLLNNNTLLRQEQITTRLLESEKAEMEREQEERRESTEAKKQIFGNPTLFLEYNKLKEREQEMLRYSTPLLQPFYKQKVNEYMINQEADR